MPPPAVQPILVVDAVLVVPRLAPGRHQPMGDTLPQNALASRWIQDAPPVAYSNMVGVIRNPARARARVPAVLDRSDIVAGAARLHEILGARNAFYAVVALAIGDVGFGADDPIPDLPIVAEIHAGPERCRAEPGRIVGQEAGPVRRKIQRAADAARRAGAQTVCSPLRIGKPPAECDADVETGPGLHQYRRSDRHVGRHGRSRERSDERDATNNELIHDAPQSRPSNFVGRS